MVSCHRPWGVPEPVVALVALLRRNEIGLSGARLRAWCVGPACGGRRLFSRGTHDSHSAGRFSDHARRNAAEVAAQRGASARADHDVIDTVVAGIVDQLACGIG